MDIRRIDDGVAVTPQIAAADIPAIAEAGFRAIICNRPDGEERGQPAFDEVRAAAAEAGIEIRFQPVMSGAVTDADADAFAANLGDLPGPVLAYCRSGTRCAALWALARSRDLPVEQVLEATRRAGYEMAGLAPRLMRRP